MTNLFGKGEWSLKSQNFESQDYVRLVCFHTLNWGDLAFEENAYLEVIGCVIRFFFKYDVILRKKCVILKSGHDSKVSGSRLPWKNQEYIVKITSVILFFVTNRFKVFYYIFESPTEFRL